MDFQYYQAEDLDRGWLNFELDLPLTPQKNGNPNPFYVERPGNPFDQLQESLPSSTDPRLKHYLDRKSYDKALEYLEAEL